MPRNSLRLLRLAAVAVLFAIACGDNIEARLQLDMQAIELVVGADVVVTASGQPGYRPQSLEWTVADPAVARVVSTGALTARVTAIAPGTTELRCSDGAVRTTADIRVRAPVVTAVAIDPPTVTLAIGGRRTLTATATYDNGTTGDVTDEVTWASDDAAVAEVAAGGEVTARGVGTTTVRATLGERTATTAVTVTAAVLTSIEVGPASSSVPVGLTVQLSATGIYDDGSIADLTSQVTWTSQASAVATVGSGDTAGIVTGVAIGSAEIRAMLGAITGSVTVAVSDAVLTAIEVAPEAPAIPRGRTVQLTATGLLSNGTTIPLTAQAAWTSATPGVATVEAGAVRGLELGTAVITAQVGAIAGAVTATVSDAAVDRLEIAPTALSLVVGGTAPVQATGVFSDGTVLDVTTQVVWSTGDTAVAQVSNADGSAGRVTALAAGTTTVGAALGGATASIPLEVVALTLQSIVVEAPRTTLIVGTDLALTATGRYNDGSIRVITDAVTWSSSAAMTIAVSNADGSHGLASALAAGTATITARLGEVSAGVGLTADAAVLERIELSPPAATLPLGTTLPVTATGVYNNGRTQDLTDDAVWTSAAPAVASVSSAPGSQGTITARAIGATTITAQVGDQSASLPVEVVAATLDRVQIDPPAPTLPAGTTGTLTATASYSDGTTLDVTETAVWASSDDAIVSVSNTAGQRGALLARATGTATITARIAGGMATATVTVTAALLTELQVAPAALTLPRGATGPVLATGIYSDGSRLDVTARATWTSSAPPIAVVSSEGVVTARAIGDAVITAELDGETATVAVTVTAATLTALQIAPPTLTLPRGLTAPLVASGLYTDGTILDLTADVTWSSSASTIASVSNAADDAGTVTALEIGSADITASFGGETATVAVTVTAATLRAVEVSVNPLVLPRGTTGALTATGFYTDGTRLDRTADASWSSAAPNIATVSSAPGSAGVVTAHNLGTTQVIAEVDGNSGSATVTVTAATLLEIQIEPATLSLPLGLGAPLVATGVYSDHTTRVVTEEAAWTSSAPAQVSVSSAGGSAGRVTALALGTATITATVGTVSASISVTATAATLLQLQVTPSTLTLPRGAAEQLTAIGVYSDATTLELTGDVEWTSSADAVARVSNADGSAGEVTALAIGDAVITASFGSLTASVDVEVTEAALVSIVVAPPALTIPAGITRQLFATGTYTDGSTLDITASVLWSVDDTSAARISNAPGSQGFVTGVTPATTTARATIGAISGSAVVTVTPALLASLRITPSPLVLPRGTSDFLIATGVFSDGSEIDVTDTATWTSSAPAVAAVSSADGSRGLVTALAVGQSTITAAIGGISSTVELTVTSAVLRELVIAPTTRTLAVGDSARFTVTGIYTDNTTIDLTSRLAWRSSNTAVATVSNATGSAGVVTAHAPGTATITASAATLSVTATVTVTGM
jgi:uncharacterized protein YjdB